jgi:hypothetical protein
MGSFPLSPCPSPTRGEGGPSPLPLVGEGQGERGPFYLGSTAPLRAIPVAPSRRRNLIQCKECEN